MGIVAKPHTHVALELARADWVNENDDAIFGTVNGGLTDPNIHATAAIAQSKIAGLTTSLSAKKASLDTYRLVDRTEVLIEATLTETNFVTVPIPAGTMNATDCINGRHTALITSIIQGSTFYLRFYWGPAGEELLLHQADFSNGSDSVLTNVGLITDFHIFNRNSAGVQGLAFVTARNDAVSGSSIKSTVTGAAKNMNLACNLGVNGLWTVADADNICLGLGIELFRQR